MATHKNTVPETDISPAVAVAQEQLAGRIHKMSSGVQVRLHPVSSNLINATVNRIPMPAIPMWHNDDKDRDEPNPNDPIYLQERDRIENARGIAALDAMIIFGVELVDGLPADDSWYEKLIFLGLPVGDTPKAREFAYLRYVVVASPDDIALVMTTAGVSAAGVDQAMASFRGPA